VAAREHECEPLVGNRRLGVGVGGHFGVEPLQELALALEGALAADPVDGAIPGNGHDPRAGLRGDAVAWPALDGECEGVLDGLLGAVEVAEDAGQYGDCAPPLLPEDGFDVD
jgi:hypothetical protein